MPSGMACPQQITIALTEMPGFVTLRVEDDGGGFNPKRVRAGMGLSVMQHRSRIMGAQFSLQATSGKGVVVQCNIPRRRA